MIAPSSEIWGKFLYSKYRTTGGSGGGGGEVTGTRDCGEVALSTKPVMLIWTVLIPATRGHVIQSKVLAMITDCSATL